MDVGETLYVATREEWRRACPSASEPNFRPLRFAKVADTHPPQIAPDLSASLTDWRGMDISKVR